MRRHNKPILILMGPTASGKSAMGVTIAKQMNGAILNADAMQCYADLSVITARPTADEMQGVPHHIYGIWEARTKGNAALWQEAAVTKIHEVHEAGQLPILLGGTGMYLKGLTEGLSPVPPVSDEVREQVAKMTDLHVALKQHDPQMAERLEPGDAQRVGRALEVMLETGRSLLDWQKEQVPPPFAPEQCQFAMIDIPRDVVYARINARFEQMLEQGATKEVAALKEQFSAEEIAEQRFPILKAHGVPEIMAYLDGNMAMEEVIRIGQQNTRHYAKRQMTWLRGQVEGAVALPYDVDQHFISAWCDDMRVNED